MLMVCVPSELCESHLIHCHVLPSRFCPGLRVLCSSLCSCLLLDLQCVEQVGSVPGCTTRLVALTFPSLCFFIFKMRVVIFTYSEASMRSCRLSAWHVLGARVRARTHSLGSWVLEFGGRAWERCVGPALLLVSHPMEDERTPPVALPFDSRLPCDFPFFVVSRENIYLCSQISIRGAARRSSPAWEYLPL